MIEGNEKKHKDREDELMILERELILERQKTK